jgi:hypothetical protein
VLLQALAEGATQRDFEIAGSQAAAASPPKGFGWVCSAVLGRLRDAAQARTHLDSFFRPEAGIGIEEPGT